MSSRNPFESRQTSLVCLNGHPINTRMEAPTTATPDIAPRAEPPP